MDEQETSRNQVVARRRSPVVVNIVYTIFGVIVALLAFRFVFLAFGANPSSVFVGVIYQFTGPLTAPFYGIFPQVTTTGAVATAVIDPATIVAIAVYALVGWVILKIAGIGRL